MANPRGAPVGNKNAAKGKAWADAIKRALGRRGPDAFKAIDDLADKLLDLGMAGDLSALKELGDRLDGKSVQQVELDAEFRQRDITDKPLGDDEWAATYGVGMATAAGTTESTR
jgi:hypothetical protein